VRSISQKSYCTPVGRHGERAAWRLGPSGVQAQGQSPWSKCQLDEARLSKTEAFKRPIETPKVAPPLLVFFYCVQYMVATSQGFNNSSRTFP